MGCQKEIIGVRVTFDFGDLAPPGVRGAGVEPSVYRPEMTLNSFRTPSMTMRCAEPLVEQASKIQPALRRCDDVQMAKPPQLGAAGA